MLQAIRVTLHQLYILNMIMIAVFYVYSYVYIACNYFEWKILKLKLFLNIRKNYKF